MSMAKTLEEMVGFMQSTRSLTRRCLPAVALTSQFHASVDFTASGLELLHLPRAIGILILASISSFSLSEIVERLQHRF
jgi:hypothetical protein